MGHFQPLFPQVFTVGAVDEKYNLIPPASNTPLAPGLVTDIVAEASSSAASAGVTGKYADAAHRHAMPALAAVLSPGLVGDIAAETSASVAVAGTVGKYADAGHVHGMPALQALAAGLVGDIAAETSGAAAVAGVIGKFADAGHIHGMPAIPGALPIAFPGDMLYEGAIGADAALAGTTTGSPSPHGFNGGAFANPPLATDGNGGTAAVGDYLAGSYLVSDLGSPKTIVAWLMNCAAGTDHPGTITLDSSNDNIAWTNQASPARFGPGFTTTGVIILATAVTARYWRLSQTSQGNTWWYVYTWSLFAAGAPIALPVGAAPKVLGVTASLPAWIQQTVRAAAGVPAGAPTGTELPIAIDTTAVTGGLYVWTGAAWVKGSVIP
jgi:hypothetical protein